MDENQREQAAYSSINSLRIWRTGYQTGLLIKTDTYYACILPRLRIKEKIIHRFITRNNPRNQIIYFRRKESCSSTYTAANSTTLSALEQIQTYRETIRQKTVIPRTSPETSNYTELCRDDPRKRVLNTSRASARSLYRKPDKRPRLSSTILKIKSD